MKTLIAAGLAACGLAAGSADAAATCGCPIVHHHPIVRHALARHPIAWRREAPVAPRVIEAAYRPVAPVAILAGPAYAATPYYAPGYYRVGYHGGYSHTPFHREYGWAGRRAGWRGWDRDGWRDHEHAQWRDHDGWREHADHREWRERASGGEHRDHGA
jgi:hypothetical protein